MIRYDKLVRDRIPEIIEANGERCTIRTLSDEEYAQRLDAKLAEELAEYQAGRDIEELVDVIELVRAIVAQGGWTGRHSRRCGRASTPSGADLVCGSIWKPFSQHNRVIQFSQHLT